MATAPVIAAADSLTVGFTGVVKPDAKLQAFVDDIRRLGISQQKRDYRKFDALFAPRVKTFWKSLDPFQPWNRTDDIRSDYLRSAADVMVEQGELEEGRPAPDYRPDAIRTIVEQIAGNKPFGTMKEMPGAICAPAEYKVDREAARAFAKKFELDAYSLRFYPEHVALSPRPGSAAVAAMVPPHTLMMFDYDASAPRDWGRYETSDGTKGYMKDRDDTLNLAQHHVCFAKVGGQYKIVALFGYGL
jgi:hypothetical protein